MIELEIDGVAMRVGRGADARTVAVVIPLVLSKDSVVVPALHAASAMSLRRFNPAIGMIIAEIGDGGVSGAWVEHYPTPYFFIVDSDRVAIKRLARRLGE